MSIALLLAWVCIVGIGFLSMGMILEIEGFFYGVLSAGVLLGLILGIRTYQQNCRSSIEPDTGTNGSSNDDHTIPAKSAGIRKSSPASSLLWFLLGTIGGFALPVLESFFVEPLLPRGRRIGTNPLGGAIYDRDQFPINLAVGLGMVATGWIIGVALIKLGAPRWLGIGVIVSATAIGLCFPF
jgi:hypothetical protein